MCIIMEWSEIDDTVHICLYLFDTQRIFLSRIIVRTSFCGLTFPQIFKKVMIDDALNLQITPDYRWDNSSSDVTEVFSNFLY